MAKAKICKICGKTKLNSRRKDKGFDICGKCANQQTRNEFVKEQTKKRQQLVKGEASPGSIVWGMTKPVPVIAHVIETVEPNGKVDKVITYCGSTLSNYQLDNLSLVKHKPMQFKLCQRPACQAQFDKFKYKCQLFRLRESIINA